MRSSATMVMLAAAVLVAGSPDAPAVSTQYDNVAYNGAFTFSRVRYGGYGFGEGVRHGRTTGRLRISTCRTSSRTSRQLV
ncbi:MAG: hypothetical protein L0271_16285 [Gemmatimonadetes bacterium]|nr:hypothetical protein [Gemmatimonadota bacterium]